MRVYRHKQPGTLILWMLGVPAVLVAWVVVRQDEGRWIAGVVAGVALLLMFLFASLTVEVTDADVLVALGPGLIRRRFPVADILDARAVTNPWYYGWGIHWTPHGWLFNVSGSEAVELALRSGRKVRIGTDEPSRLLAAIRQARASGPS